MTNPKQQFDIDSEKSVLGAVLLILDKANQRIAELEEENKRLVLLTESVDRARKRHGILNKY